MFKSKVDATIIPQAEHQRLAGTIASLWGNNQFDRPHLPFESYVQGVLFHDRGYGYFDDFPIGELEYEVWESILRKGLYASYGDSITDVVACLHIKRLIQRSSEKTNDILLHEAEDIISKYITANNLDLDELLWADRITALCDNIAFDFSFRESVQETCDLFCEYKSDNLLKVHYEIDKVGNIHITPWPLAVNYYTSFIFAYQEKGYNNTLIPERVMFHLTK